MNGTLNVCFGEGQTCCFFVSDMEFLKYSEDDKIVFLQSLFQSRILRNTGFRCLKFTHFAPCPF